MSMTDSAAGACVLYKMSREMVVPTSSAPDSTSKKIWLMYVLVVNG